MMIMMMMSSAFRSQWSVWLPWQWWSSPCCCLGVSNLCSIRYGFGVGIFTCCCDHCWLKKRNIIISFLWCVGVSCGACVFNGLQVRTRLNIQLYEDTLAYAHIIYMHRHTYTQVHSHMHAHMHTHTITCMRALTHVCAHTHMHLPLPPIHTHTLSLSVTLTFPPKGSRLYVTALASWGWSLSSARQISELTW